MEFLNTFFSYDFQFYVNSVRLEFVDQVFAVVAAVCIVLAAGFRLREHLVGNFVARKLMRRLSNLFMAVGIMGALWYGVRYEHVILFGSHFIFLLILLAGVIWLAYIGKYWRKNYKLERNSWEKEQVKLKYLK